MLEELSGLLWDSGLRNMKDKDLAMATEQRSVVLQVTGLLSTKC